MLRRGCARCGKSAPKRLDGSPRETRLALGGKPAWRCRDERERAGRQEVGTAAARGAEDSAGLCGCRAGRPARGAEIPTRKHGCRSRRYRSVAACASATWVTPSSFCVARTESSLAPCDVHTRSARSSGTLATASTGAPVTQGRPLAGPVTEPLAMVPVRIEGNTVIVGTAAL